MIKSYYTVTTACLDNDYVFVCFFSLLGCRRKQNGFLRPKFKQNEYYRWVRKGMKNAEFDFLVVAGNGDHGWLLDDDGVDFCGGNGTLQSATPVTQTPGPIDLLTFKHSNESFNHCSVQFLNKINKCQFRDYYSNHEIVEMCLIEKQTKKMASFLFRHVPILCPFP